MSKSEWCNGYSAKDYIIYIYICKTNISVVDGERHFSL